MFFATSAVMSIINTFQTWSKIYWKFFWYKITKRWFHKI